MRLRCRSTVTLPVTFTLPPTFLRCCYSIYNFAPTPFTPTRHTTLHYLICCAMTLFLNLHLRLRHIPTVDYDYPLHSFVVTVGAHRATHHDVTHLFAMPPRLPHPTLRTFHSPSFSYLPFMRYTYTRTCAHAHRTRTTCPTVARYHRILPTDHYTFSGSPTHLSPVGISAATHHTCTCLHTRFADSTTVRSAVFAFGWISVLALHGFWSYVAVDSRYARYRSTFWFGWLDSVHRAGSRLTRAYFPPFCVIYVTLTLFTPTFVDDDTSTFVCYTSLRFYVVRWSDTTLHLTVTVYTLPHSVVGFPHVVSPAARTVVYGYRSTVPCYVTFTPHHTLRYHYLCRLFLYLTPFLHYLLHLPVNRSPRIPTPRFVTTHHYYYLRFPVISHIPVLLVCGDCC